MPFDDITMDAEVGTCVVHVAESRFEADIISEALGREGIGSVIRKHEDTAYNGIFVPQKGWGDILVPISTREKALKIIREITDVYRNAE